MLIIAQRKYLQQEEMIGMGAKRGGCRILSATVVPDIVGTKIQNANGFNFLIRANLSLQTASRQFQREGDACKHDVGNAHSQ